MNTNLNDIPETIDSQLDLDQIRTQCLDLVEKAAYCSAGAAAIPIPFVDFIADLGILSQLIPQINARFGLNIEHMGVFDPKTKKIHWDELRKRGVTLSSLIIARSAVKSSMNNTLTKYASKKITRFIPFGRQVISAGLGYLMMKKIAQTHIDDCYNLAKQRQNPTASI